jgi:hypothetical protein
LLAAEHCLPLKLNQLHEVCHCLLLFSRGTVLNTVALVGAYPDHSQVDAYGDNVQNQADLANHPQAPPDSGWQPPVKVVNKPPVHAAAAAMHVLGIQHVLEQLQLMLAVLIAEPNKASCCLWCNSLILHSAGMPVSLPAMQQAQHALATLWQCCAAEPLTTRLL